MKTTRASDILDLAANGHLIGTALKAIVSEAIHIIAAERFAFEASEKSTLGKSFDVVTSADHKAESRYAKKLTECFPGVGIVGEEGLNVPCTLSDQHAYFTVDPLDGTKAYARRQSGGYATMIALVVNEKIVSAYVGDVVTREIYGYRPGSTKVHRITGNEHWETLQISPTDLNESRILLRNDPRSYHEVTEWMTRHWSKRGRFGGILIDNGSIGLSFARLWKGEVAALHLATGWEMPWDWNPVLGISERLGFCVLEQKPMGRYERLPMPCPIREKTLREAERLVIHESNLEQFLAYQTTHC